MRLWFTLVCAAAAVFAQTTTRITGRITTGRAEAVRGEVLAITTGGTVRISPVPSDSQGLFTMDLNPGRVLLVAQAPGYVSEEKEIVVRAGPGNSPVHFALSPAGSVSGRVIEAAGAGVAGARVWVLYPGESRRWRLAEETGGERADDFGYFTLPAVAQGRPFVLQADAEQWLPSSSGTLMLRSQEMPGVLLLLSRRGAVVRGRVVDAAGNAIAGAQVRLRCLPADEEFTADQRLSPGFAHNTNKTATSGSDGSYAFAAVAAGQIIVTAQGAGRRAAAEALITTGHDAEITLTLR